MPTYMKNWPPFGYKGWKPYPKLLGKPLAPDTPRPLMRSSTYRYCDTHIARRAFIKKRNLKRKWTDYDQDIRSRKEDSKMQFRRDLRWKDCIWSPHIFRWSVWLKYSFCSYVSHCDDDAFKSFIFQKLKNTKHKLWFLLSVNSWSLSKKCKKTFW